MYNLLIVDDEPLTRKFLKMQVPLISENWQVAAEAMDGSEALSLLERHSIDLILTDIKMPVMNGLELCKQVSRGQSHVKLVILSGHDEFSMAKEAIQYGVHDYLLKPIVLEQLAETLNRIAADLESIRHEELAVRTLRRVSNDTTTQVVKNFLKAVVAENGLEIKTLYPLIYRLNVNLIEAVGAVMIIDLDLHRLLNTNVPARDAALFRFIVHQVAMEIAEQEQLGTVFLDEHQRVCCLVPGDDEIEVFRKCVDLHQKVGTFLRNNAKLTVTSSLGSIENDILQMHQSYHKARRMLQCRLLDGGDRHYNFNDQPYEHHKIAELDQLLTSIQSAFLEGNKRAESLAVNAMVDFMLKYETDDVFRYGVFLIDCLSELRQFRDALHGEAVDLAFGALKTNVLSHPSKLTRDEAVALFTELIGMYRSNKLPNDHNWNEAGIVTKAKEYIYTHYSQPLSLALIAEKVGVSSPYLSNLFHKQVHESYIKFLTRVRMEQAAKMLKFHPPEKIYDVATKVGYISAKHFSHVFKQFYGMPPGEYQEAKLTKPGEVIS